MNIVDIAGVPLDLGAGRRGVDMGPSAFRIANVSSRISILGYDVNDQGNIPVPIPEIIGVQNQHARYVREIGIVCEALYQKVLNSLNPVILRSALEAIIVLLPDPLPALPVLCADNIARWVFCGLMRMRI